MAAMSLTAAATAFHPRSDRLVRDRSACTPATAVSAVSSIQPPPPGAGAPGSDTEAASSPIQIPPGSATGGRRSLIAAIAANSPRTRAFQYSSLRGIVGRWNKENCSNVTSTQPLSRHQRLLAWVDEWAAITQPDQVLWCDGSAEEYDQLAAQLVEAGTFQRLSDPNRPNSYWAPSDPADVARVEDRTFICSAREEDA